MVAAVVWSLDTIKIIPEFLYDAPEQTWDLFQRMWPFDWAYYPKAVQGALIETIHMATLGTLLALVIAVPVALLGARNITPVPALNWLATAVFVASRSVNSLIWALLFVAVFGPGPLAGTLAIAFRSIGFVGKLLSEALEEAQPGPIEALSALGAPFRHLLLKGYWPQVEPGFWGIVLLRWDINIRESSVLGLVGAGGIGMALDAAMSNLYWDQAGLILAIILVVVLVIETVTTKIRRRII
ncbi:phosphonate ABC transporter, permease protein PhnE [Pikeienuella piscinae]|uniref:Phosphonate ABC transporter, permease protein PhnE n=2 Tax=Pikeienuella piscinae TaxID=2748098 RepID=A0A7M3T6R7_9RHOB|nr:phosphonate ABC transporter, permease protein PhnE [Pikeienuella piscinae]